MNTRNGTSNQSTGPDDSLDERIGALKDSVKGLADFGTKKVGDVKERAVELKDEVWDGANSYVAKGAKWIKANPYASVGIAFGIGYLGMRLVRR
jgi:ElaB/YqjD/DUF883 family membrane-anchored ribosome-binding protein